MVCACSRSDPTFGLGRSFGGNASNRVGPLAQIRLNLKTDPTRGGLPWRWNGLNFETKPTPPWLGRECLPSQQGAAWVGIPRHPDLTRGELEHMAKSSFRALISRRGGGVLCLPAQALQGTLRPLSPPWVGQISLHPRIPPCWQKRLTFGQAPGGQKQFDSI